VRPTHQRRLLRPIASPLALLGLSIALATFPATGCATSRPVLYPNRQLSAVGPVEAQREVDACMAGAQADVGRGREGEAIGGAVVGGVSGAAAGAAGGAIVGRAGTAAAVGASAGAARGLVRGLFRSLEPDAVYRGYVNRCLRSRGFDVAGWR